jgi:hypothetical protein
MHLQQRRENDEKKRKEIAPPGFDATVDQFYDYVEEDPENSFIESDQTVAAGAGHLYARNGTHLYGQTLTFQLPPPTVEEVEARIDHDIQQNMLDGAKARAIATVVGTRHNVNINALPACGACGARYNSSNDVTMQYRRLLLRDAPQILDDFKQLLLDLHFPLHHLAHCPRHDWIVPLEFHVRKIRRQQQRLQILRVRLHSRVIVATMLHGLVHLVMVHLAEVFAQLVVGHDPRFRLVQSDLALVHLLALRKHGVVSLYVALVRKNRLTIPALPPLHAFLDLRA